MDIAWIQNCFPVLVYQTTFLLARNKFHRVIAYHLVFQVFLSVDFSQMVSKLYRNCLIISRSYECFFFLSLQSTYLHLIRNPGLKDDGLNGLTLLMGNKNGHFPFTRLELVSPVGLVANRIDRGLKQDEILSAHARRLRYQDVS